MPAFLDPRIPTGLQRTCTKYTVPGRNPASLQEVWFPTSSTTCRERHPKQSVTSNTYSGRIPHTHTVTLTGIFNVLYKKKKKPFTFKSLSKFTQAHLQRRRTKKFPPFCASGEYTNVYQSKRQEVNDWDTHINNWPASWLYIYTASINTTLRENLLSITYYRLSNCTGADGINEM